MSMLVQDRGPAAPAARLESLLGEIEAHPDPAARAAMSAIVQNLVALYGEGLARILAIVEQQGDSSGTSKVLDAFVQDDLIAHLLLLHDLHPVPLEERVRRALEEVRPYLQSHGGNMAFLGVEDGVARLRLQGSCSGCPSSTYTLKQTIEQAIERAAPDLEGLEVEGVAEPARPAAFVPAASLQRKGPPRARADQAVAGSDHA